MGPIGATFEPLETPRRESRNALAWCHDASTRDEQDIGV